MIGYLRLCQIINSFTIMNFLKLQVFNLTRQVTGKTTYLSTMRLLRRVSEYALAISGVRVSLRNAL